METILGVSGSKYAAAFASTPSSSASAQASPTNKAPSGNGLTGLVSGAVQNGLDMLKGLRRRADQTSNMTAAWDQWKSSPDFNYNQEVATAITNSLPILFRLEQKLGLSDALIIGANRGASEPLVTKCVIE